MIELITLILVGSLLLALWREIQKQQTRKPASRRSTPKAVSVKTHQSVKRETQDRLYAMCGGDHKLVLRLTRGGGQAAWEKAIHDLERDRR